MTEWNGNDFGVEIIMRIIVCTISLPCSDIHVYDIRVFRMKYKIYDNDKY